MDEQDRPRTTPIRSCPGCGSRQVEAVTAGAWTNVLCHRCGTCWRAGLRATRVDPLSCSGCRSRRVCLAALAERSP